MKVRRIYRNWDTDDCRIKIMHFINRRTMPVFNPHFHNELEIIYFVYGSYEVYRENGSKEVEGKTIYIVPPNEIHSVRSLADRGEYICVAIDVSAISMSSEHFFQKGFVEPLQSSALLLPRMIRSADPGYSTLVEYLEQLRQMYVSNTDSVPKRFIYAMGLCTELMAFCSVAHTNNRAFQQESSVARQCIDYMNANFSMDLSLKVLAKHVHVHPNYLCSVFKKDVGMTVMEYLCRIRVERAREILRKKDISIGRVAELCGFQSVNTFQRTFKSYTGTTPSKYARNFRL